MHSDSYLEETKSAKLALTRARVVPRLSRLEDMLRAFSPGERLFLYALTTVLSLSAFALLAGANRLASVTIPASGGVLIEGAIGPVRFLNPLLALSGPDRDISTLIYSGLMRAMPDGTLIPDLAERYEITEDGTTYTFTLRPGLSFHDGTPLTSADVLFTVQRAQNPDVKSPRRADWESVAISAPDARTIQFTLPHAYAPFLENATLGILPKHLWESVTAEEFPFYPLNTRPVGSGPYKIKGFDTNTTGSATTYELSAFKKFALGQAHLKKIAFNFYPNEEELISAFNASRVDAIAGISPSRVEQITRRNARIVVVPLPRTFGIFLNQNKNTAFADVGVRAALDAALDKQKIVDDVLKGYGAVLESPIPPGLLGAIVPAIPEPMQMLHANEPEVGNVEKARAILSRSGWIFTPDATSTGQTGRGSGIWEKKGAVLSFTLATADDPELAQTAEEVASYWRQAGVQVNVHVYPLSELNSVVLRPRNYEAVLFGEVVGRTLDLFAFWHSSQRNDPGLNIALYTNAKVDSLLAKARAETKRREREKLYEQFIEHVAEDQPAVFLYAPKFIYVVPKNINGIELGALTHPSDRFLNVHEWYAETERVWNIFTDKQL